MKVIGAPVAGPWPLGAQVWASCTVRHDFYIPGEKKEQQLTTDVFYPLTSRKQCLSASLFIGLLTVNKSHDI